MESICLNDMNHTERLPPEAREKLKQSFIQGGPSGVAELEEFKTLAELSGCAFMNFFLDSPK